MGRIIVGGARDNLPLGLLSLAAIIMAPGCGGNGSGVVDGGTKADGGNDGGRDGASGPDPTLFASPVCRTSYPAQACDGDPSGKWTLAGLCANRYENCPGAVVKPTGTATATIDFQSGSPVAYFEYTFNYDIETRLSVPASCLGGASCESIGCFAGDDPCSCILGSGSGGFIRAPWMPNISGEVVTTYSEGSQMLPLRFCAGATTADSSIGGRRALWNRVCEENMDCRPSNPCHFGHAHCAGAAPTCEDMGGNRQVGAACGTDKVCDASGSCVACAAGASCQLANQPCKAASISCSTAMPVCVAKANLADGAACGVKRACLAGVCKSDDGELCTSNAECRESCTCGDAQCTTRSCGRSCPCGYAPPAGLCAGLLADGTQDPGSCTKACFQGRCLTEIGQTCTTDAACGSGHCTCWNQGCNGGRICSKVACPCQWVNSGADACGGPLMDGLMDFTCRSPQMCVAGTCT